MKTRLRKILKYPWSIIWMRLSGIGSFGRICTRVAELFSPGYKARRYLATLGKNGYISSKADISKGVLHTSRNVFIGDNVTIYKTKDGGRVTIGEKSSIHKDTIIETGQGGVVKIGEDTHIQPRCQLSAYLGSIIIGNNVQIAPNCSFYPYNHECAKGQLIKLQPLTSKGGIVIEEDVWIGVGAVILDGVTIGRGAIIGANAVVNKNVDKYSIFAGVPAKKIGVREN